MSDITPRPNCACLPVTSSEVTTRTRLTASCSLMLTSTVADAVPVPRVSRPLPSSTKRGGGLVLGDEPGRAGVARRDRPDLDADSPGDLVAVDPLHGREIVTSLQ